MTRALKVLWHLLASIGLIALIVAIWFGSQGISTQTAPGTLETAAARMARHVMIPSSARDRRSPEAGTAETLREGLEHWADHCASCHGNDGSGATAMGQGLYPRVPDMRQPATQTLTDGELFYIIENGVKLTGMPAWGTGEADGERASWHLVQFIRRLPTLTDVELLEMDELNPRGPDQWRALEEERRFLSGVEDGTEGGTSVPPDTAPPAKATPTHRHKGEPQ